MCRSPFFSFLRKTDIEEPVRKNRFSSASNRGLNQGTSREKDFSLRKNRDLCRELVEMTTRRFSRPDQAFPHLTKIQNINISIIVFSEPIIKCL